MPSGVYIRTKPIWNKGLTKEIDERIRKISKKLTGRKGKPLSKEARKRLSEINKGKKLSLEHRKKIGEANKGKHHSKEYRDKLRKKNKRLGIKPPSRKGATMSEEARRKISDARRGIKCRFWKGGITAKSQIIRTSIEYRLWREAVFARDNWTCQDCGKRGSLELHSHHIKSFARYPKLRFAIDNGKTLCKKCHRKTDTYGSGSYKEIQEIE